MVFNPYAWYWLADDGRIFSSASETQVSANDSGYQAFLQIDAPTPWPRDDDGDQTDDSLQAVLDAYGKFASLNSYNLNARWLKEQGGMTVTGLSVGSVPIKTDDRSQAKINGVRIAIIDGKLSGSTTTSYFAADRNFYVMSLADMQKMSDQLQSFIASTFTVSQTTTNGIAGGTITTRAQVDQAYSGI
jgi:hypothetical protein